MLNIRKIQGTVKLQIDRLMFLELDFIYDHDVFGLIQLSEKRRIKLKYIVQSNTRPPTIKIFTSHNGIVSKSYKRYLENSFRNDFGLPGTPIRIIFKSGDNPFTFSKR